MAVARRVFLKALLLAAPVLQFIRFAPGAAAQTAPPAPASVPLDDKELGAAIRYDGTEGANNAQSLLISDANARLPIGWRFEIRDVPSHMETTRGFGRGDPVFVQSQMAWYHLPCFADEKGWLSTQPKRNLYIDGYILRGRFVSTGEGRFLLGQRRGLILRREAMNPHRLG